MNIRLLKVVVFYGIGVLSSNLLASARNRDWKVMKFPCRGGASQGEDSRKCKQLRQKAGIKNPKATEEALIQAYERVLRDNNLEGVDEDAIRKCKLAIRRGFALRRAKNKINAEFGWMENKECFSMVNRRLNAALLRDPERWSGTVRAFVNILFEQDDISDENRACFERTSTMEVLGGQNQEPIIKNDRKNHCTEIQYNPKE
jgi:hypothetical protein